MQLPDTVPTTALIFKHLALGSITLLPTNQYTFLVIYNFVIFSVSSKSFTEFHSTILDFQREKQISILMSSTLASSTCTKIFKPHKVFPHEPFSLARLESTCGDSQKSPKLFSSQKILSYGCKQFQQVASFSGKFCS